MNQNIITILLISDGNALILGVLAVLLIIYFFSENKDSEKKILDLTNKIKELETNFSVKDAELKVSYQNWAIQELEKFKQKEIDSIKKQETSNALILLQKWKIENEAAIRQDAINRSYSVNLGKITEHLVPFHQKFLSQFNPKDARFIGSPIDLIVFDGYADKKDDINIYLVEIKTGNSKLTEIQKKIKTAVLSGNIRWAEVNPDLVAK